MRSPFQFFLFQFHKFIHFSFPWFDFCNGFPWFIFHCHVLLVSFSQIISSHFYCFIFQIEFLTGFHCLNFIYDFYSRSSEIPISLSNYCLFLRVINFELIYSLFIRVFNFINNFLFVHPCFQFLKILESLSLYSILESIFSFCIRVSYLIFLPVIKVYILWTEHLLRVEVIFIWD